MKLRMFYVCVSWQMYQYQNRMCVNSFTAIKTELNIWRHKKIRQDTTTANNTRCICVLDPTIRTHTRSI